MNEVTFKPTDTTDLALRLSNLKNQSASVRVTNVVEHEDALVRLQQVAALRAEIEDRFAPSKKMAHKLHKEICTIEKGFIEPLDAIDEAYRTEVIRYEDEARRTQEAALKAQQFRENAPELTELLPTVEVKDTAHVSGISGRDTWKAEVTDIVAFAQFVLQNPSYTNLLAVNESALNKLAKAHEANLKLPGVLVYCEKGLNVRGRS